MQREEALNTELARLLALEPDVDSAVGERKIGGGKSIDVLIKARELRIAVEAKLAKTGWSEAQTRKARSKAKRQAAGRVSEGHADVAVSVLYPRGSTTGTLAAGSLEWAIAAHGSGAAVHSGTVSEFAGWLTKLTGDPDAVVALLLGALTQAADMLEEGGRREMAEAFNVPEHHSSKGAVRLLLMVAAAVMFHSRLQSHMKTLKPPIEQNPRPPQPTSPWPPQKPIGCANAANPVVDFDEAWRQILLVDYKPVFESAREVLTSMAHTGHNFTEAVRIVAKAGLSVAGTAASMRHDLLGRVFHRVLDTARYDGSFYTSAAAAVLLAGLALTEDGCDWSDPDKVHPLRVCDPCCGSGTLLMAASERIRDLRSAAGASNKADDYQTSAKLIEDMLWAYDINLAACHLTATTLGLLAPSVRFNRMNIFWTRLGVENGEAHLGSLDLLPSGKQKTGTAGAGTQLMLQPMAPGEQKQVETDDHQEKEKERASNPPAMDLVIMNPPFTRDSLRHDQHTRADELKIKAREKELLEDHPHREAARLHSSDGMFLLLGEHLAKADEGTDTGADEGAGKGTLALVLPAVVATTGGALGRRKFLSKQFQVEFVVASHDPKRIAFSENTAISEMLVVARRHPNPTPPPAGAPPYPGCQTAAQPRQPGRLEPAGRAHRRRRTRCSSRPGQPLRRPRHPRDGHGRRRLASGGLPV